MAAPRKNLGFLDVLRFAAGYWKRQPKRLSIVLGFLLLGAAVETYLPNALAAFLGAIRQEAGHDAITNCLLLFLGLYLAQALIFAGTYRVYNVFETYLFKDVLDDAFEHVYRLPSDFTPHGSVGWSIAKISCGVAEIGLQKNRVEDQIGRDIEPGEDHAPLRVEAPGK